MGPRGCKRAALGPGPQLTYGALAPHGGATPFAHSSRTHRMRRQKTFTRADRLEHLLLGEVERVLSYEVRNPLAHVVRVTGGHLSPDLGHLRVQYILEDDSEPGPTLLEVLERTATFVGRTLQESFQLRVKPTVAYHFDRDAVRSRRVAQLLAEDKLLRPPAAEVHDANPEPSGDTPQ